MDRNSSAMGLGSEKVISCVGQPCHSVAAAALFLRASSLVFLCLRALKSDAARAACMAPRLLTGGAVESPLSCGLAAAASALAAGAPAIIASGALAAGTWMVKVLPGLAPLGIWARTDLFPSPRGNSSVSPGLPPTGTRTFTRPPAQAAEAAAAFAAFSAADRKRSRSSRTSTGSARGSISEATIKCPASAARACAVTKPSAEVPAAAFSLTTAAAAAETEAAPVWLPIIERCASHDRCSKSFWAESSEEIQIYLTLEDFDEAKNKIYEVLWEQALKAERGVQFTPRELELLKTRVTPGSLKYLNSVGVERGDYDEAERVFRIVDQRTRTSWCRLRAGLYPEEVSKQREKKKGGSSGGCGYESGSGGGG
mmetsp:Transcript_52259/g.119222  ORF Transcript_52259/g.119222 Transcript_52259/m.119222 type:complete len:369 (+) Transcript_52259:168-1274(+)